MRILVTGARGRLGSILADWLVRDGHEVVRFSRNADAKFVCLGDLSHHLRNQADIVLHLAWSTVPASAEKSPGIEWRDDLPLLSTIASECTFLTGSGRRAPLLVFFSSCSAYGEFPAGRTRPFDESDPLHPKGWYASGKKAAEELLDKFRGRGLRCLILRVSNPFGFVQSRTHLQGFVPVAAEAATQGSNLVVWGDGSASKDFLDVRDLYSALRAALDRELTGTFNVCSGESHSITEVVRLIEKATGARVALSHGPAAAWDVQRSSYGNRVFKESSGWLPRVTLEQGIRDFLDGLPPHTTHE
jgi:UDP-glucose 4-epimerase